jgi:Tol biopolymer transport system component
MDMQKIDRARWWFGKLPTAVAIVLLALVLVSLVSFQVKAARWSTPTQVTFNMNIADDWGGPSISRDGSKIVFQRYMDGYYRAFVVNSDGTGLTQVTKDQRNYVHLSISGDGSKIAVASYASRTPGSFLDQWAYVINADGTGVTPLLSKPSLSEAPQISDDGSKVALVSFVDNSHEIFVVNSDGTGLKQLTNSAWSKRQPSISSDGHKIAFASYVDGDDGYEIFVINSDGTGLTQVTNSTADNESPSISGDGSKIAFLSREAYTEGDEFIVYNAICVINSDGTGLTQLINSTAFNAQPSVNYDGSKITFSSSIQPPNADIFVINSDGTGLQQITQSARTASYPSINGDGSKISFISFEGNINGEIFVSVDLDRDKDAPVTIDDYDDSWHILNFQINLTATDDLSGVAETYYKVNGGSTKNVAAHGQPSITEEGANNTLEYWSVDVAGKEETHRFLTGIKLDKTAPTGSVIINNDENSTSSPSVVLALSANDSSGVTQMRFSNNGTDWTSWETYATSKNWTLSSEDGEKVVYVQFKDTAGWVSESYSDTISLDTTKESAFPIVLVIAGVAGVVIVAAVLLYIKKIKVTH